MALDARTRSSILDSLVPLMGEHNANALMSEFPSVEAVELVTKRFGAAVAGAFTLSTAILGTLIAVS